jgi:hypothetical protein
MSSRDFARSRCQLDRRRNVHFSELNLLLELIDPSIGRCLSPPPRWEIEKETDHLAAGIWPPPVGVGLRWAAAGPCTAEAMNHPLLHRVAALFIGVDGAGISGSSRRPSSRCDGCRIREPRLRNDLVGVHGTDGQVPIAVEYDRTDGCTSVQLAGACVKLPSIVSGTLQRAGCSIRVLLLKSPWQECSLRPHPLTPVCWPQRKHCEISRYGTLRAWAEKLGYGELQATLRVEGGD